jgi:CheY-like chemotaxis protein
LTAQRVKATVLSFPGPNRSISNTSRLPCTSSLVIERTDSDRQIPEWVHTAFRVAAAPRVLVVEDDDAIRTLLAAALRREPFDVDTASDGATALQMTRDVEYAVIVLDLMMPRLNGFDFLAAFHGRTPKSRSVILVITAFDDAKVAKLEAGHVHAIVRKPFDVPQLVTMIREVTIMWQAKNSAAAAEPLPPEVVRDKPPLGAEPTN